MIDRTTITNKIRKTTVADVITMTGGSYPADTLYPSDTLYPGMPREVTIKCGKTTSTSKIRRTTLISNSPE